jgi:hypothetical protein
MGIWICIRVTYWTSLTRITNIKVINNFKFLNYREEEGEEQASRH